MPPEVLRLHRGDAPGPGAGAPLMSSDQLAALLLVDLRTVQRWDSAGKIPGKVRLPGRLVRWRRDVIEKWLAEGCPAPAGSGKARGRRGHVRREAQEGRRKECRPGSDQLAGPA